MVDFDIVLDGRSVLQSFRGIYALRWQLIFIDGRGSASQNNRIDGATRSKIARIGRKELISIPAWYIRLVMFIRKRVV